MESLEFLGAGPGDYRIGVLALANDQVIERDLGRMLPPEILTYTSRIAFSGDCTLENLSDMTSALTTAAGLLNPEVALDAVLFGCTSGSIALGCDGVRALIQDICPDVLVVNPIDAACAAFAHLGTRRLNLVTPYEPELANLMARCFSERGLEIVNRFDFGIVQSADISRITPEAIRTAAGNLPTDGVDATFMPCTDFQSLYVLEDIETATGLPAISSNSALVWALLNSLNVASRVPGFGLLLAPNIETASPIWRKENATN